ncbi:MAG: terminase family protein [Chitinispirillia bacterium]|nr:terminase family protein [Chitinispirillia bacterium]
MATATQTDARPRISPQEGPQWDFCSSKADIIIYGGQAGGGKSFATVLLGGRYYDHPKHRAIIFRRTHPEIVAGGGLWDTAGEIYPAMGGVGKNESKYVFPSGARVEFSHMQHENDRFRHQGAQYSFIGFDELPTFERSQFLYMISRLRPPPGFDRRCRMVATCNPDADSWVVEFIEWYIDEGGYPIPKHSGVIKFFTIEDNKVVWVDRKWRGPDGVKPFSFTFISASVDDNPALLARDPNYKRNLYAQDLVTRERLLKGNWRISYTGGMFDPSWFIKIQASQLPQGIKMCRYWDFAATEVRDNNDPDWTSGALLGTHAGNTYIMDIVRFRATPGETLKRVRAVAERDGRPVMVAWEEEKASAGKLNSHHMIGMLAGFTCKPDPVSGDKVERAKPLAAAAEFGRVYIVEGEWNKPFLAEAGSFPMKKRDQIDSVDGAHKMLTVLKRVWPEWSADYIREPGPRVDLTNRAVMFKNLHVGAVVCAPDGTAVYAAAAYDPIESYLCVYEAKRWPDINAVQIASYMTMRSALRVVHGTKLLGNEDMFGTPGQRGIAQLINNELGALQVPVRLSRAMKHDEPGAIAFMGQMFQDVHVDVLHGAAELGVAVAGWCYEEGGKRPERGCGYGEALCLIASELRQQIVVLRERKRADYAAARQPEKSAGGWMAS